MFSIRYYDSRGVSMRKQIKTKKQKCLSIFLAIMLISTFTIVVASAEESDETASAGAQAIAIGDETETVVQATVNDDGASSSATSRAKAENGGTATAIAEAWANWYDGSSAYARAMAVAVAGIGETIWAEANAQASVSSDGISTSNARACVGDAGCLDPDPDIGENTENKQKIEVDSTGGGFNFGKNDIERYCVYKLQLSDNNTENDVHASYSMNVIAWGDYGFTNEVFENKFGIDNASCIELIDGKKLYQFIP